MGRLKDVVKQTESISDSAIWLSLGGEQVPIREVVERYLEKQKTEINTIKMDDEEYELERIKQIFQTINFFEDRYGGTYEQVLMEKGDPDRTDDWKWGREGKEWIYHLREIRKSPFLKINKRNC